MEKQTKKEVGHASIFVAFSEKLNFTQITKNKAVFFVFANNSPKPGMQFGETTKKGSWICLNFCGLFRKPELYTNNSPKGMQFGETNEEGSWTCPNREVYLAFNFGSRKY